MTVKPWRRWGALWRSDNELIGSTRHLIGRDCQCMLFKTRREAREWIEKEYAYIRTRPDLQAEPHGWKMPVPVRVLISVDTGSEEGK